MPKWASSSLPTTIKFNIITFKGYMKSEHKRFSYWFPADPDRTTFHDDYTVFHTFPSKHAGTGSDPARKRLAGTGPEDSCTLACFRSESVWPQPDMATQNQIGSGSVSHNMIRAVCGITRPNRMRETVSWPVAFCQNRVRWFFVHRLASGLNMFGQNLTRPPRTKSDLGQFCTIWSEPYLEERKWIRCGKLAAGQLRSDRTKPNDTCTAACFWPTSGIVLDHLVRANQCATIIQPGSSRPLPLSRIRFMASVLPQMAWIILCETSPDLIWFLMAMSGCGQTALVTIKAEVQKSSGPVPAKRNRLISFPHIRFCSVLPQTARIILCETVPDPTCFQMAMSGCGQTDSVRKKTGVQESPGLVLAKRNRPATSF